MHMHYVIILWFRRICTVRSSGPVVPPCDDEFLEKHRLDCWILSDPEGPFGPCQEVFDAFTAFSNCVFDLCAANGNASTRVGIR